MDPSSRGLYYDDGLIHQRNVMVLEKDCISCLMSLDLG